jgi:hypothetical protein
MTSVAAPVRVSVGAQMVSTPRQPPVPDPVELRAGPGTV